MKSYVVIWCDLLGRFHCKSYVYRKCCEKFAVRLVVDGRAENGDVRVSTFKGRRMVRAERTLNKGVR